MWRFPFGTITACLVSGILLGYYLLSLCASLIVCLITVVIFLGLTFAKKPHICVQFVLIIALISAASIRLHLSQNYLPGNHIGFAETDQIKSVEGRVIEVHRLPEEKCRMIISVSRIWNKSRSRETTGKIIVTTRKISQHAQYGTTIRLYGNLECLPPGKNPGQFDYRMYLSRQDIYHRMTITADSNFVLKNTRYQNSFQNIFIESLRTYCYKTFSKYLHEQAESLAFALFLGEKQGLDSDIITQFKRTGVVHILAISGLHVGFIIVFVLALSSLLRLPELYRIFILIIVLFIYIILINLRPPVIRASLMAILLISAKQMQRTVHINNVILAAASVILLMDPRELFNPGFQFSFIAVLSITNGYDAFNRLFPFANRLQKNKHKPRFFRFLNTWIWIPFLVSCSATIGTLPLTWYYYGFIPLYAALANLFIIPLTGLLVLLIIFLLLLAPVSSYLAFGIAGVFLFVYKILLYFVSAFSNFPLVSVECVIPSPFIIIGFLLLVFLFFHIRQKASRAVFLPLLSILILFLILPDPPRSVLRAAFLDVGQGDATVLQFPNKNTMLIDAGNRNRHWDNGSQVVIPYLQNQKIQHLNYVVLSHPHNDHLGGMISIFNRVTVDTVITTKYNYRSRAYQSFLKMCALNKVSVRYVKKGDLLYPDSSCRVYVLHPDSQFIFKSEQDGSTCNNSSIVLKILYGQSSMLFTGDAEIMAEESILTYGKFLKSEILKIGHHGSTTSTSVLFLNEIQPICAVISVAGKNRFNHPSPIILERLYSCTPKVYQTRQNRAVIFELSPQLIKKVAW